MTEKPTPKRKRRYTTEDWAEEALAALDLRDVYGDHLTGTPDAEGWIGCVDPLSTSSEGAATARVSDKVDGVQRASLHRSATGEHLSVFEYLIASGKARDVKEAQRLIAELTGVELRDDELPDIVINEGPFRGVVDKAARALRASNYPVPVIYERLGSLVRIVRRGHALQIEPLDRHWLHDRLCRVANWLQHKKSGLEDCKPPTEVVSAVMASCRWPFPKLDAVIATPMFTERGRIIAEAGYHRSEGLYLSPPAGWTLPSIPERPTSEDVRKSRSLILDDAFVDFPFVDDADKAHAVAALLLLFVRRFIKGSTPLHVFSAPTPGSGKTLLCDVISIIATGNPIESTTIGADDAEIRKKITSELVRGVQIVLFDNVDVHENARRLDSRSLASVLTTDIWSDRLLGRSKMVSVPNTAAWFVTGNNVQLTTELYRRSVWCRLDPDDERPERRTGFKHAALRDWIREHRVALVHACLVLVSAWLAAGRPRFKGKTIGSLEQWIAVVGGVLQVAEVPGFLDNLQDGDDADAEGTAWRDFVEAWWEMHGTAPRRVSELNKLCNDRDLLPDIRGDGGERSQETRLGNGLSRQRDRIFGGRRIVLEPERGHHGRNYRLELTAPESTAVEIKTVSRELHEEDEDEGSTADSSAADGTSVPVGEPREPREPTVPAPSGDAGDEKAGTPVKADDDEWLKPIDELVPGGAETLVAPKPITPVAEG